MAGKSTVEVSRVFKPAQAVVDSRGKLIGPVVIDPARAQQACDECNASLRVKHPEFKSGPYHLKACVVEVME